MPTPFTNDSNNSNTVYAHIASEPASQWVWTRKKRRESESESYVYAPRLTRRRRKWKNVHQPTVIHNRELRKFTLCSEEILTVYVYAERIERMEFVEENTSKRTHDVKRVKAKSKNENIWNRTALCCVRTDCDASRGSARIYLSTAWSTSTSSIFVRRDISSSQTKDLSHRLNDFDIYAVSSSLAEIALCAKCALCKCALAHIIRENDTATEFVCMYSDYSFPFLSLRFFLSRVILIPNMGACTADVTVAHKRRTIFAGILNFETWARRKAYAARPRQWMTKKWLYAIFYLQNSTKTYAFSLRAVWKLSCVSTKTPPSVLISASLSQTAKLENASMHATTV